MLLLGMLDSPYVRRVAISLQVLRLPFEHRSLSVFRTFDEFAEINPVVKAPTLVCDDGSTLMDSTLILAYAQALAGPARRLAPTDPDQLRAVLRLVGLALAACDKAVQIIYERSLRPADIQYQPWIDRVRGQLLAACAGMEAQLGTRRLPAAQGDIDDAGICVAVTWKFCQMTIPEIVIASRYPALQTYSDAAETLPEFAAAPYGDGTFTAGQV